MDMTLSIIILFSVLGICLLIGVPIAFALGLAGIVVIWSVGSQFFIQVPLTLYKTLSEFVFVAIPLYILMGEILYKGKSGERIFNIINSWLYKIRGGTGIATVSAFTFFAAIVGSSMASVFSMGKITIPELLKQNYPKSLTYGVAAVGGSLGILIPPSMAMILYASLTGASPSKMFIAGIIPGLLIALCLAIIVVIRSPIKMVLGDQTPAHKPQSIGILKALPDLFLPFIVLGGIYAGIYTPSEAAAVGVIYAIVLTMIIHRSLPVREIPNILKDAVKTSTMLLSIVVGALVFGAALTLIGLPQFLSSWITEIDLAPWIVLLVMNLVWLIMGFFLEVNSILLITTPIFFPIAMSLGFDPIWFGIIMMINMEMAVITPPVGMNLFAIKALFPNEQMGYIIKSVLPFTLVLLLVLILIWVFPELVYVIL
jgi:C4-dicarboxylate transporter DctM subunit